MNKQSHSRWRRIMEQWSSAWRTHVTEMKEIVHESVTQSISQSLIPSFTQLLIIQSLSQSLNHSLFSHSISQLLGHAFTQSLSHWAYLCFVFSTHCLFTLSAFWRKSCKAHTCQYIKWWLNHIIITWKDHPPTNQPSSLLSSSLSAPKGFRFFFLADGLWWKNANNNEWPSNARQVSAGTDGSVLVSLTTNTLGWLLCFWFYYIVWDWPSSLFLVRNWFVFCFTTLIWKPLHAVAP